MARTNLENDGQLMPVFFVGQIDKTFGVIGAPFSNDAEKDSVVKGIRDVARVKDADFVAFISESWMVQTKSLEDMKCKPSEHPDRIEVVSLYVETFTGKWSGNAKIFTRPDGKKSFEEMDVERSPDYIKGRFVDLLPRVH